MRFRITNAIPLVLIFVAAVFTLIVYPIWLVLPKLHKTFLDHQLNGLTHQLDIAITLLDHYFSSHKKGTFDEQTAQLNALEELKLLRYGPEGKDYFFVLNEEGILLAHPYKPELEGQSGFNTNDAVFAAAVRAIVEAAKQNRKFAEYDWYVYGEQRLERKISAIRTFEPWSWIIGTGLYSETLEEQFEKIAGQFRRVIVAFGVIYVLVSLFFTVSLNRYHKEREKLLSLQSQERERLQIILSLLPQPIAVLRNEEVIFMNQAFRKMFVQKTGDSDTLLPEVVQMFETTLNQIKKVGRNVVKTISLPIDQTNRWFEVHAIPRFEARKVVETIFILIDTTRQVKQIDLWKSRAKIDRLTGLANRNVLEEISHNLQSLGERFCVIMLDLDGFKKINDVYGHIVGDEVLKEVARRLLENARKDTILIRYGGDEMLLIVPNSDKKAGYSVAQRLQEVVKKPFQIENLTLNLSVSVGLSQFPEDGNNLETLIRVADERLYRAKAMGKGGLCTD
ncbi:hypothetical protein AS159_03210 [Thermotoga sp. Ku-13t]|uniref:diguanylate cyclase n=1 Tax=Thermotoga sp. Ku-13t TaxID=1755813 RepID=UPI0013EB3B85|nr:diguanylate cyclase [Thermotoga sp. Ku-13t]KAF2958701.1 hypothetical protein AS159_03210 [Thermotoga sp. Ku-13t]